MNKERKNLLVFGLGLSALMGFFGVRWLIKGQWVIVADLWLLTALILFCVTLRDVNLIKPLYTRWMKIAHVIGNIFTGIILCLVFYSMFSLIGILLKILRKDLLDERLDAKKSSYWIKREKTVFDKNRCLQQF